MKILFIAPIPPPVTGQSLAVKVIYDELEKEHQVEVINLNKESFKSGLNSLKRLNQVAGILKAVWRQRKNNDIIYFAISESFAGNMKDLVIYLICFKSLRQTIIHMLGGAGMKRILESRGIQFRLNNYFINRLGGIIVEGNTQFKMFSKIISPEAIHVVPNFAEDFLFVSESEIEEKFYCVNPITILYLSNLIYGKGYVELVDAYLGLSDNQKEKIRIVFVGGFESDNFKSDFLQKINGSEGLEYLGLFISGNEKKKLYLKSHVFCLPTYYPFEGQPISILEAYATGCVVITTNHSGIPDVFSNGTNGFEVEKKSADSIRDVLQQIIDKPEQLLPLAISNRNVALEKYRTSVYTASLIRVFDSIGSN